ncbi:MAG TPA: ABC transporter ATP-binding protein [Spirochaetes bacterium]|nr:ABC transporter ATP-binding protein [Spirochaetota bacterium]
MDRKIKKTREGENNNRKICLEVRNVVKRFGNVTAVNGVSLKIKEREIFSLLGPSGCGKTTLLRLIAGLESLDEGDILIDNTLVNNTPPYKRNCSIVFQQLALFPHMTVDENIAFGLERKKMPKADIRRKVKAMLILMQLEGMENRRPQQLSGGQQQRVALARSLVLRPNILLLDEPLASLDRKLRKEMQVELKRIQREVATTFLYVTHDQKVALSLSDRIGVMRGGNVIQTGKPGEIYESPKTGFVASFMGSSNIFRGNVVAEKGDKIQVQTEDGLRISAFLNKDIAKKDITGVSVNPEAVQITNKNSAGTWDNAFKGRVREVFYQGDFTEVTVLLNDKKRLVTLHLSKTIQPDFNLYTEMEVCVYWNSRYSNVLAE